MLTGSTQKETFAPHSRGVRVDDEGRLEVNINSGTTGLATSAKQDAEAVLVGAVTETAPATDTASSGLNGRLQRIAQRLTSLIALLPTALTAGGNLKTAILESIPEGTATIGNVTSVFATSGFANVTTSGTAGTYTAFASQACKAALIRNNSGVSVKLRQDGAGAAITMPDGDSIYLTGITNLNQFDVTLVTTGSAVVVDARWEA